MLALLCWRIMLDEISWKIVQTKPQHHSKHLPKRKKDLQKLSIKTEFFFLISFIPFLELLCIKNHRTHRMYVSEIYCDFLGSPLYFPLYVPVFFVSFLQDYQTLMIVNVNLLSQACYHSKENCIDFLWGAGDINTFLNILP